VASTLDKHTRHAMTGADLFTGAITHSAVAVDVSFG